MIQNAEARVATASSDTQVHTGACELYWAWVSAGATGGAWSIEDGEGASGTVRVAGIAAANNEGKFIGPFDPPLKLATGLFLDIGGSNVTVTVGYN